MEIHIVSYESEIPDDNLITNYKIGQYYIQLDYSMKSPLYIFPNLLIYQWLRQLINWHWEGFVEKYFNCKYLSQVRK